MPEESPLQGHGSSAKASKDNSVFVGDDSDVARIFMQVTGTTIAPELLNRLAGMGGAGEQAVDAKGDGTT